MALIKCPDCSREVSSNAPACPGCGSPIASRPPVAEKGSLIPYSDQEVAVMLSRKKKTSHLLHLFLSVITFGLWIVVWIIVALSNNLENTRIDRTISNGKRVR